MAITKKEYRKNHPKMKRAMLVCFASVACFFLGLLLFYSCEKNLSRYCEYLSTILFIPGVIMIWLAKKQADSEYEMQSSENIKIAGSSSAKFVKTSFFILGWIVFAVFMLPDTEGINAKIDASQGFDNLNYHPSLRKATEKMAPEQVDAYNWAVDGLDVATFVGRYGKSPTVKDVVVGQANFVIKRREKEIKSLEGKLAGMKSEVAENEAKRREAYNLLQTIVPRDIVVGYSKGVLEARKKNDNCKDLLCSNQGNDDYPPNAWYVLDNPKNLKLSDLPCTISYQSNNGKKEYSEDFNCVNEGNLLEDGSYYVRLSPGGNENFLGGIGKITIHYKEAKFRSDRYNRKMYAIPELLPELEQLDQAKRALEHSIKVKKLMN